MEKRGLFIYSLGRQRGEQLSGKKTNKNGIKNNRNRNKGKRFRKRLRTFMLSLAIVLAVGGSVLFGYSAFLSRQRGSGMKDDGRVAIELNWLTNQAVPKEQEKETEKETVKDENAGAAMEESADAAGTSDIADEIISENERLYNEALEKGEHVKLVQCADSGRVTFAFAGDILFDDEYAMMFRYRSRGSNINDTFSDTLLEKMRGADVFMLNNEFPFSTRGEPTEGKAFTFRANPANVELYGKMGADIVSLANNHAYDYGVDALLDTFTTLENAGIPYVGAGRNIEEAKKPLYLIANGMKIGIVSATQIERNGSPDTKEATATRAGVLRCMDPAALLESIATARENSDFVILYIHWGTESEEQTDWLQDKQAPIYAEAGVDLIIGDHPHCLQKIGIVSGVPVIYSLGNFWFNSKTQDTCLIEAAINKEGMEYLRFVPCRQEDCRTRELEGTEKEGVLNYMRSLSSGIRIDEEGYILF